MGKLNFQTQIEPIDTPLSGIAYLYIDSADDHLTLKDSAGNVSKYITTLDIPLSWLDSALDFLDFTTSEPVSPTTGDRYINTVTGTSSETSQSVTATYVYEWDGSEWVETVVQDGDAIFITDPDPNEAYVFNGAAWVNYGTTTNHNTLSSLQGGTTDQYYHLTNADYLALTDANAQLSDLHTDGSPTFAGLDLGSGNLGTTGTLGLSGADLADGVTATTQSASDNSTKIATTAYVDSAIITDHNDLSTLQGGTIDEYYHLTNADYLSLTDVNAQLSALHTDGSPTFAGLDLGSGNLTITGTLGSSGADIADGVTATTQSDGDNSTKIATTAYVDNAAITDHNTLSGLQGGTTDEYYHLNNTDYSALTDVNAQLTAIHTDGSPTFVGLFSVSSTYQVELGRLTSISSGDSAIILDRDELGNNSRFNIVNTTDATASNRYLGLYYNDSGTTGGLNIFYDGSVGIGVDDYTVFNDQAALQVDGGFIVYKDTTSLYEIELASPNANSGFIFDRSNLPGNSSRLNFLNKRNASSALRYANLYYHNDGAGYGLAVFYGGGVAIDVGDTNIGTYGAHSTLIVDDPGGTPSIMIQNGAGSNPTEAGRLGFAEDASGTMSFEFHHDGSANTLALDTQSVSNAMVFDRSTGHVGFGTAPSTDVAFEISSTSGAFMPPRMNTTQRNALSATVGMVIFNTSTGQLNYRNYFTWVAV